MTKLIHNFSVYIWLSALMAVSFAGAAFGFGGIVGGLAGLVIAGLVGLFSLTFAYNSREQKDALKTLSDGAAVAGIVFFLIFMFTTGIVVGLIILLFFLHIAINLAFREHRQVYFGLLVNFVALMTGAVNTFSAGYLFIILLFCICACFYMALVFVDKQRYAIQEMNEQAVAQPELSSQSTEIEYLGDWQIWDKLFIAGLISLIAGVIYLLTPHFPAGNMSSLPIEGFGKYDNSGLEEQILPEGTNIDGHFHSYGKNSFDEAGNGSNNGHNQTNNPSKDGSTEQDSDNNQGNNKQPDQNNGHQSHNDQDKTVEGFAVPTPKEQLDNSIFYYVKSDKPRYMQFDTATFFDGRSWKRLQYGWRKLANDQTTRSFTLYPAQPNASVGVTVVKEPNTKHLITTDNTIGIRFPSRWVASDYYDQLKTGKKLTVDTSYQLMLVDQVNDNTGRMVDIHQASPDAKDLQLPNNLDPRIKQLGDSLVAGLTTNTQKAQVLEQHLRSNYEYTLDTVSNQNNIPLTDFLFGSQRGHCEYYATAMAVMLRQQGIPARMISGYVAHDYNPVTGYYEVKGTNGHAWVQAYVDNSWVIYEATGAYNSPQQDPEQAKQTRNTSEIIENYLEQINEQDQRLEEVQELTLWQKVQLFIRSFWYMIVLGFTQLVAFLRLVLPWVLAVGLIGGIIAWLVWKNWQSKAVQRADKKGLSQLHSLAKQTPSNADEMKAYYHAHLQLYQKMLERHDTTRPIGQQIEAFTQTLLQQTLCTQVQADILTEFANGAFYLTHKQPYSATELHTLFIELYHRGMDK